MTRRWSHLCRRSVWAGATGAVCAGLAGAAAPGLPQGPHPAARSAETPPHRDEVPAPRDERADAAEDPVPEAPDPGALPGPEPLLVAGDEDHFWMIWRTPDRPARGVPAGAIELRHAAFGVAAPRLRSVAWFTHAPLLMAARETRLWLLFPEDRAADSERLVRPEAPGAPEDAPRHSLYTVSVRPGAVAGAHVIEPRDRLELVGPLPKGIGEPVALAGSDTGPLVLSLAEGRVLLSGHGADGWWTAGTVPLPATAGVFSLVPVGVEGRRFAAAASRLRRDEVVRFRLEPGGDGWVIVPEEDAPRLIECDDAGSVRTFHRVGGQLARAEFLPDGRVVAALVRGERIIPFGSIDGSPPGDGAGVGGPGPDPWPPMVRAAGGRDALRLCAIDGATVRDRRPVLVWMALDGAVTRSIGPGTGATQVFGSVGASILGALVLLTALLLLTSIQVDGAVRPSDQAEDAPFFARVLAAGADLFPGVLLAALLLRVSLDDVAVLARSMAGVDAWPIGDLLRPLLPVAPVAVVLAAAAGAAFERGFGSTPGKFLIGARLAVAPGRGAQPPRIVLRNLLKALTMLCPLLLLAVWIHPRGRLLHDRAGGTRVVLPGHPGRDGGRSGEPR